MFTFVACNNKEQKNTDTGTDIHWEFDETDNQDAALWENNCDSIIEDISNFTGIQSVSIAPTTYETYMDEGKVVITCYIDADVEIEDVESGIKDYIDATNAFDEYELVFQ